MNKRKYSGAINKPFKRPRQTLGAAVYNTFARAGAFSRPSVRRSVGMMSRRNASELKGADINLGSGVVATTTTNASSFLLNGIAPGSASFNRIGRKVTLKSLRLKGGATFTMTPSATGAVNHNSLRMVVVFDRQPNSGSIPTWDTIFGITAQDGTETSTTWAPMKYDNMSRFQVLKDKTIDCQTVPGNVATTGVIDQWVSFDEFMSLGNRESTYSGQSAPCTTADISTGALYVYFRSQNQSASATVGIDTDSVARLRYQD